MNIAVTDVSPTRKELVVTVPGEIIATEATALLGEFKQHVSVPGFRPGKAPEKLIQKRFGAKIQEELNKKISQKVYEAATKHEDFEVYTVVHFGATEDFKAGEEANVDVTVDIVPAFELPAYKGLEAESLKTEVSDEEVEQTIEAIRRQRADFEPVERPAEAGDYVQLTYTGTVDGQPVAELIPDEPGNKPWGTVEKTWEEAGTDEAKEFGVPSVIDGVVGMAKGDKKEVTEVFAEDFKIEALQGKTATYAIEVLEVRERKLPPLDEAFLKSVQAESLEEFKATVLDQLEARKKREAQEKVRRDLLEKLTDAVEFPVPESAVEEETQQVMGRVMMQNMRQGVPEEEFEKNKEAFHAQAQTVAQRDVKLQFILQRIAKEEGVQVEEEDLQRAVYNIATQQRRSMDDLVKDLQKDRRQLFQIQRQVLFQKTLDFLAREAKVTEVDAVEEAHDHDHEH